MTGFGGGANNSLNALLQSGNLASQSNQIGQQSALSQGAYSVQSAALEANGIDAQLLLQQYSTQLNIQADFEANALKNSLVLTGKALETATLISQHREKLVGMFAAISQQRSQNTWSNIKQMVSGFKF